MEWLMEESGFNVVLQSKHMVMYFMSIHSLSNPAYSFTQGGQLKPLPAVAGRRRGHTLD